MEWDTAFRFVGIGSFFQRLRDWFIENNGLEAADRLIPQYEIDSLKTAEPTPEPMAEADYNEHSQHNHEDHDMELKEQLETLSRDFSEVKSERDALKSTADAQAQHIAQLQQSVEDLKATNTRREMENYCDGLISSGKMLASEREFFIEDLVAKASAQTVNFSEGVTALQATKTMLEARPAHKLFQEHATDGAAAPGQRTLSTGNSRIDFSEQDSDIDVRVRAVMAEKNISYTEALDLISTEL
jgi:polyhydroxyalkanoate synthesis regulator phasin